MIRQMLLLLVVVLCMVVRGVAQPVPGQPQPEPVQPAVQRRLQVPLQLLEQQQVLMMHMPQGLFALRSGVLVKYDPMTLRQQSMLELFGPEKEAPDDKAAANVRQQWFVDHIQRLLPAAILQRENDLLIIVGDKYFRVDAVKLAIMVSTPLAPPIAQVRNLDIVQGILAPPILQLHEQTLYVMRGSQLLAVNIADGAILARGVLPEAMLLKPVAGPRQGARNMPAVNDQPREVTVVGEMANHAELDGGCWTVQLADGNEYILEGDQLPELLKTPELEGSRVRLTGMLSLRMGIQQYGDGYLAVNEFQVLPKE